jgi:hypothetical protein
MGSDPALGVLRSTKGSGTVDMTGGGYAVGRPSMVKALVPRRARRPRTWYVTAAHGMYQSRGRTIAWIPGGPVHLKMLGVARTACGVGAIGWQVFWLGDPRGHGGMCPECLDETAEPAGEEA